MGFAEYTGNGRVVTALRGMLTGERVAHAMLFSGPRGVGKYTLARMFAQAANCEGLKDDFCGECGSCRRIERLADPAPLIAAGLAERGESADAATVERAPLLLQTDPDVWAIVPDPIRLRTPVVRPVIHVGQLRAVQRAAYFKPAGRRRVFILDGAETMRWDLANIFLKILEEPPESATLILLTTNPHLLLPTIRSRCLQFFFAPISQEQVEGLLEQKTDLPKAKRALAAQLAEGSPGAALGLDLEQAALLREQALRLLQRAREGRSFALLFSETSRLAKDQRETFETLLEVIYSLLNDLLELTSGPKDSALRNPALREQLIAFSSKVDPDWVGRAVRGIDELHSRLRRNINRQLGLDAVAISLANRAERTTGA